jgi:ATP-dependent DNA helicase RecQ
VLAREVLGLTLRPAQRSALAALSEHRDTLAVLPTGSGKSAIYQIGGLLLGGLTVVVSPLIALQRDQMRALSLRRRLDGELVQVAVLNSSQKAADRTSAIARLRRGDLDFVMLGPEQLANAETHAELVASPRAVTLMAVDEAHLVSQWGHDFRPEYLRLTDVIDALGRPPLIALTATAAPPVQADITRELGMREPAVVVADFDRPNIRLAVRRAHLHVAEEQAIVDRVVEVVLEGETPALVYAMSHARCEDIAERLRLVSFRASPYHAGMHAADRSKVQDAFFQGRLDVVAATSAFGMGIDKPDVRTVIHGGVPASLDEYYQEIGRAGRDGLPANAVLVYDSRSLRIPRMFAARSRIASDAVTAVTRALASEAGSTSVADIAHATGVSRRNVERVVEELDELGLVALDDQDVTAAAAGIPADTSKRVADAGRRRQTILGSQIDSVRHYAETIHCRRAELLAYFGEAMDPPCRNCDNDDDLEAIATKPPEPEAAVAKPSPQDHAAGPAIAVGATVNHRLWGRGTLLSQDEHELVVAFDSVGYRHLTPSVLTNGLVTLS